MIRINAPVNPQTPYDWNVSSIYQCVWYVYYRAIEEGFSPPCYYDRQEKRGSYTNAKLWLENFREPWEVKTPDYIPVHGDIAVFDGNYGHVIFIEDINSNVALISEYNRLNKLGFDTDSWVIGGPLVQCGKLLGYLHYPNQVVEPVERNINVNQIQTTDNTLRVRLKPGLDGQYYCNVQIGYYNVLFQKEKDGYIWYEIEKGKYCADVTTIYLPKVEDTKKIIEENKDLKNRLKDINKLSEVK